MKLFDVYPLNPMSIVKAEGSYVWDHEGTMYLDFYGGHAVISVGHTHPYYVQQLVAQLHKIGFYSNSVQMPLQVELAELLGRVSGKEHYQLFLCNSGAEANENALKLASFYNGRKKIIVFKGCFHGRTSLAVAATDNRKIIAPVNETENVVFLPHNDEASLLHAFETYGKEICAVLVEGVQGVGGIVTSSSSFLQCIRTLCDAYDAVFIADSVQCGYGRTGQFYAHDDAGINADIYSMAKGMGNGFPIGGIAISPKLKPWHGMLGTTFGGNHLACAAAIAVLEIIEKENLMANAKKIGDYLLEQLKLIPQILEIRGRGLMVGIVLPSEYAYVRKHLLFKYKIFTGEAQPHVIRLLPALNISKTHVDIFISALKDALNDYVC